MPSMRITFDTYSIEPLDRYADAIDKLDTLGVTYDHQSGNDLRILVEHDIRDFLGDQYHFCSIVVDRDCCDAIINGDVKRDLQAYLYDKLEQDGYGVISLDL